MKISSLILFLGAIGLMGCATPAQQLDPEAFHKVCPGMAQTEVQQAFGLPFSKIRGSNGKSVETYIFQDLLNSQTSTLPSAHDFFIRSATVLYSPEGRVENTLYNECRTRAWLLRHVAYAGPDLTPESIAKIHSGTTTREDLEQLFQKPMIVSFYPTGGFVLHWYQVQLGTSLINPNETQGLHVYVDDKGIVRDFSQTDQAQVRRQ